MAKKTAKKKTDGAGLRLPDWEKTARIAATATTVLLISAIVIGLLVGRGPLQARAAKVTAQPVKISIQWPPYTKPDGSAGGTWVDAETQQQLEALAMAYVSRDPFNHASLTRARDALAATGWFASGPVVRRLDAGVVRIEGRWRIPFAVVRHGSSDFLVTAAGERLEKTYPADSTQLPLILGAPHAPPVRLGDRWPGNEVQAGLNLLSALRSQQRWWNQVRAVDVAQFNAPRQRELAIVTRSGGRIRWGGPVEQPFSGETPSVIKLRHLDSLFARTGRIDGGQSLVDIRFGTPFDISAPDAGADRGAVQSRR